MTLNLLYNTSASSAHNEEARECFTSISVSYYDRRYDSAIT